MAATALITGGTGGLGVAVTQRFLLGGWRVVVPWKFADELRRVERHDRLELVEADLLDAAAVARCVGVAARDAEAPLGAVVNLVGSFSIGRRIHETRIDEFEEQLRLNLRPAYLVSQGAIPHLLRQGGGAIVCVSSRAAKQAFSGAAGYVVAKAAVLAFVDALTAEYREDGIRANAILPSIIDTPANRAAMPDADTSRWVRPGEIAETIHFLCSADAASIVGAHVPIYGRA